MSDSSVPRLRPLLAVLVLILLAGCHDFPTTKVACQSCEVGIERGAAEGLNVTVERSTLDIRIDANGDARWIVRSRLSGTNVSTLADDPDLVDSIANRAVTNDLRNHEAVLRGSVGNVSGRLDGRTLVIEFGVESMGESGVGSVVVVDRLHWQGSGPSWVDLGTDRIVLHGPPGTVVTSAPPGTVGEYGRTVVWTAEDGGISGETYVAFGEGRCIGTRVATTLSLAVDIAEWLGPTAASAGAFFSLLWTLPAGYLVWRRDAWPSRMPGKRTLLAGVAVVGLAVVAVLLPAARPELRRSVFADLFVVPVVPVSLFGLFGTRLVRTESLTQVVLLAVAVVPFVTVATLLAEPPRGTGLGQTSLFLFVTPVLGVLVYCVVRTVGRYGRSNS